MTTRLHKMLLAFFVLLSVKTNAQFALADVKYWIGSGTDSSVLVIDFHDATWDTSYAWGYLHNGSATGGDMVNAVAAADINFSVSISSGFLSDISYGTHAGIGGTGGFYWSTWSGTSIATMSMNGGLATTLSNGDWFGCSFTDFSPAFLPGEPIAAFEPLSFVSQDVQFWVGTGTDTALLIIDFLDGSGTASLAWGYLYNGNATGEDMLNAIAAADPDLTVVISGGFLNDITYASLSGMGGSPDYWATWSATNLGNWDMNMGISTSLSNGDLFGCSYTNFAPAIRPGHPTAVSNPTSVTDRQRQVNMKIYPNPATDFVNIQLNHMVHQSSLIKIIDVSGKTVFTQAAASAVMQIPVQQLPDGLYTIMMTDGNVRYSQYFIKQ